MGVAVGGEESPGGKSCTMVGREDTVAVYPISVLLTDDVKEKILAIVERKCGVEVWEDQLVA